MPKTTTTYVCQQCGYISPQFLGKCPECETWNSLVEQVEIKGTKTTSITSRSISTSEVINLSDIQKEHYDRLSSNIKEFDRVLGGGIVKGSLVLVSGDPGIGKSTLLSQLALNIKSHPSSVIPKSNASSPRIGSGEADRESNYRHSEEHEDVESLTMDSGSKSVRSDNSGTLYIAGEESAGQIKLRIERIQKNANLAVLNEVDVDVIDGVIENLKPPLVIVDSIQTMQTADLESVPGSVSQVRECAHRLQRTAKSLHIPVFIVGHVTKEGTVAGPKTLEHLVDVVLSLEGDPNNQFRILRATKNRFGPTDEVGIFEMEETGMVEVKDPSKLFLEQKVNAPGSAVVATLNGFRPLLLEIQALVTKSNLAIPRRIGTGIDNNRLQLLIAVLSKRLNLPLFDADVFVNVTGGIKIIEPAADLGICMAIISSFKDISLDPKSVFIGEVGLLGELRNVRSLDKRINEAKKIGLTKIISPQNAKTLSGAIIASLEPRLLKAGGAKLD